MDSGLVRELEEWWDEFRGEKPQVVEWIVGAGMYVNSGGRNQVVEWIVAWSMNAGS